MGRVVVDVMPKPEILDPQGKAVAGALARLGFTEFPGARQGKRFELEVEGEVTEAVLERARVAARTLLSNPVIEDVVRVAPAAHRGEQRRLTGGQACRTPFSTDVKKASPSVLPCLPSAPRSGPNPGSTACSGCGMSPTTVPLGIRDSGDVAVGPVGVDLEVAGHHPALALEPVERRHVGHVAALAVLQRDDDLVARLIPVGPGRRRPLDPQPLVAADELAVVVAHECAGQQVRLAEHLEAVADAEHGHPGATASAGPASRTISAMIGENRAMAPQRR